MKQAIASLDATIQTLETHIKVDSNSLIQAEHNLQRERERIERDKSKLAELKSAKAILEAIDRS